MRDYRNTIVGALIPHFGAERMVNTITTDDIDAYRERSGDFNVLTPAQVDAVAAAATNELVGTAITVAAYAGLRLGEVRALRWRDVDFAKRSVFVRRNYTGGVDQPPKSGKVRSVPMVDQALVALDRLSRREHNTSPDALVFCEKHGFYLPDDTIRNGFYDALEAAGLGALRTGGDPIVFHDLRHTFGTLAVHAFPLTDVKADMGHEDVSTTMIYAHHVPRYDAADKLRRCCAARPNPLTSPRARRLGQDGNDAIGRRTRPGGSAGRCAEPG